MSAADAEPLYAALDRLRGGAKGAPRDAAWGVVMRWLDAKFGRGRDHEDLRQVVFLKVDGAVDHLAADSPGAAARWLRRVYENARNDLHRRQRREPYESLDAPASRTEGEGRTLGETVAGEAPRSEWAWARLGESLEGVLDAVEGYLAERGGRPAARETARQNAELACLAHVHGLGTDVLAERLGLDPRSARARVQKRLQRGRDDVLLPALAELLRAGVAPPGAGELVAILEDSRRADAGKARPGRRKKRPSHVSPANHRTSVQNPPPSKGETSR